MNLTAWIQLIGYMAVCSFTPGPGNILALNTTSQYGWKNSKPLILGICAGYGAVQALCTVALYELNQVFSAILEMLHYVGAVYMLWLAYHIIISKPDLEAEEKKPTFREGFLLQFVNVKIYFYITSLLSVYFIPNIPSVIGLAGAGAFAVSIGSLACLTWAFLGVKLQTVYSKHYRAANLIMGLFLVYCAWAIAFE